MSVNPVKLLIIITFMETKKITSFVVLIAFTISLFSGCDTTSTDAEQGNVELQIKTVAPTSSKAASAGVATEHDSLIVEGTNGTLRIDDIRFIVEEFELDPADGEDDSAELEEFEAEPFFVDLPLNEETLSLANSQINVGLYEELEFEVENLDFEDAEDGEDEEHQALADTIRSHFPDWPDEASMVITGTFTPDGEEARPFKVFAEAEIEIELEFNPPLEVTADNMQQVVSVRINPARWFEQSDGTVFDLSEYDWDNQQELLEFSAEFEDGLEEIEVEDDDDDGDDD